MSSLRSKSLTTSLTISKWLGQRLDRTASSELLKQHNAADDAGKFTKLLVPKTALDPIQAAEGKARQAYYKLTLPWLDGSIRLLASDMYFEFRQVMLDQGREFWQAVNKFLADYPKYQDAAVRMGSLFSTRDYPTPEVLKTKFGFKVNYDPLPDASDWRVDLGEATIAELVALGAANERERLVEAQRDLTERLLKPLRHFATTMGSDKKFHDTTVDNLLEIAQLVPRLDLSGDPALAQVSAEVIKMLKGVQPDALRKDKTLRADVANSARAKLAKLERTMSAFAA